MQAAPTHTHWLTPTTPHHNHASTQVLAFLASDAAADADAVLGQCLKLGETNFKVMAMLDDGHTSR
jgi:hypothetical protein